MENDLKRKPDARPLQEGEKMQMTDEYLWKNTDALRREICMYKRRKLVIYLTYFVFYGLGLYLFWTLFTHGYIFIFPEGFEALDLLFLTLAFFILTIGTGFAALHILNYIHYLIDKRKIQKWIQNNPNDNRKQSLLWSSYGDYWGIWGMGINKDSLLGYSYK